MALTKEQRYKAVTAQFSLGMKPKEVIEHCKNTLGLEDIKQTEIYDFRRQYLAELDERSEDTIQTLVSSPDALVDHMADEVKKEILKSDTLEHKGQMLKQITDAVDNVKGLKALDCEFQDTMMESLRVAKRFLSNGDITIEEWKRITDTLAKAHMDIFSSTTNIHIGDNNKTEQKLSVFQNQMRS